MQDISVLQLSVAEASSGAFESYSWEFEFTHELQTLWSPPSSALPSRSSDFPPLAEEVDVDFALLSEPGILGKSATEVPQRAAWSIAFTPTFRKTVADVDKKLQGRVLAAISELSESPTTVHGDTVKPLSGEFKGLWRYRVGDYRLVYEPRQKEQLVILLQFAPRGGVYEA